MKSEILILDLDDTLIDTSHVYWIAKSKFLNLLTNFNIEKEFADRIFEEVETKNIQVFGHDPLRYQTSMVHVYDRLRVDYNLPSTLKEEIESIGLLIATEIPPLLTGAMELLKWAKNYFRIIIYTRGDEKLQNRKIERSRIRPYVDEIEVVPYKDTETLHKLMQKYDCVIKETWLIGDSIKSDINPAVETGINSIYYKYSHHSYTWSQEYNEKLKGSTYQVTTLLDAKKILNRAVVGTKAHF